MTNGAGALERIGAIDVWRPGGAQSPSWCEMLVTTRNGGQSDPPYESLNLGLSTGDEPATVRHNRTLLCETLSLQPQALHLLQQTHGDRVVEAGRADAHTEADGLWTAEAGRVLVIGIADCVPVFLWDPERRALALVHAGWRGAARGIVARAVEHLRRAGSAPEALWMAQGPSIGACCYEVGADVAAQFAAQAQQRRGDSHFVDLRAANRDHALSHGVPSAHVLPDPPCTACDTTTWFSHRRQGPRTGRMWALAWRAH